MNDTQSTVSKITALKQQQAELLAAAKEERADLLASLAGLCALLGPLVRSEIPDGILKRRERKAPKVVKVRKPKAAAEGV